MIQDKNSILLYEHYVHGVYGNQKYTSYLLELLPKYSDFFIHVVIEDKSRFHQFLSLKSFSNVLIHPFRACKNNFFRLFFLLKIVRNSNPSLLLANNSISALFLSIAAIFYCKPLFWHIKAESNFFLLDLYLGLIARKIIFISPQLFYSKSYLFRQLFASKVLVLPIGVHLNSFLSIKPPLFRDNYVSGNNPLKLLYLGSIGPRKGLHILLKALQMLPTCDFLLDIVGGYVENSDVYKTYIHSLSQHQANVRFSGWSNDIPKKLECSHVLVLPSFSEGTPRSIVEAMAAARPVISTNVGGIPFLIRNNYNGYLVEPNDYQSIACALQALADNQSLVTSFGLNGRKLAVKNHDIINHFKKLSLILEQPGNV